MDVETTFNPHVQNQHKRIALERFGMHHGQFYSEDQYLYKNLFWVLDGDTIGFGDLRMVDVASLLRNLKPGEVFEGFNENHGSQFQQTPHAMIKVMDGVISFPNNEARGFIAHRRGDRYVFEKKES